MGLLYTYMGVAGLLLFIGLVIILFSWDPHYPHEVSALRAGSRMALLFWAWPLMAIWLIAWLVPQLVAIALPPRGGE